MPPRSAHPHPSCRTEAEPPPPVIPEVEPRPESRGETIRDLIKGAHDSEIPDSRAGARLSGMTGNLDEVVRATVLV